MGWLASTPKGDKVSRIDQYAAAKRPPPFLEPDRGHYLFTAMMKIGPVENNGMTIRPRPWSEIIAFCGNAYEWWEIEAIAEMCGAYFRGLKLGENPMSIMPIEQKGALDD